jgi:ParB/RepB/Spo0J family partition protein
MTEDVIVQIPIDQLHESPFNPRKRFTGIKELADTMRPPNGRVLQALLVRPRVPPLFAGEPDLASTAATGYEVVFGHRRRRGGIEAGLATLPCMVRAMTDAEARHCQVVENLQREDVHPFEEAEGFEQLMREDRLTADQVAEQFGKSRSYVYGRLKLLQACPEVRDACLDGKIGSEVALLVARLRTAKLQEKALAAIRNDTSTSAKMDDGGKRSFRHIRDLLADKFTLELKAAIFDPEDATLCPQAGTCSACPKRSGNAPEFEDLASKSREGAHGAYFTKHGGPDICTDPDCFAGKKAAHLARKATEAAESGATVISGNKAKAAIGADGRLKGYVALKDVKQALKQAPKGTEAPQVVTIIDQRTGQAVKAVKTADLPASAQPKPQQGRGGQRDYEAERRERQAAVDAEQQRRAALLPQLRDRMLAATPSADELRLVLWMAASGGVDWQVKEKAAARHGVDTDDRKGFEWTDNMAPDQMRLMLMDLLLEWGCDVEYQPDDNRPLFDRLVAMYGAGDEGTSTPPTAGAGAALTAPAGKGPRNVMYTCPDTLQTWSGRGLRPAWVKAALARGVSLDSLLTQKPAASPEVEPKGMSQKVEAGFAGGRASAGADLFEAAGVAA